MPRVTSQRTRQALLVLEGTIDPAIIPEKLQLFDADGNPLDLSGGTSIVPGAGADGQLLAKASAADYDLEWVDGPVDANVSEAIALLDPDSWWKLDETAGAFADSGANGFPGTIVTAPGSSSGAPLRGVMPGLDGEPYVTTSDTSQGTAVATFGDHYGFVGVLPFTIVLFHYPTEWGGNFRRLLMKNDSTAGPFMGIDATGHYGATRAGSGASVVLSPYLVALRRWHMVVMRYNGAAVDVFHNGKKTSGASAGAMPSSANLLRLHGVAGDEVSWGANGGYQHLAIWEKALTDAEVASIYKAYLGGR